MLGEQSILRRSLLSILTLEFHNCQPRHRQIKVLTILTNATLCAYQLHRAMLSGRVSKLEECLRLGFGDVKNAMSNAGVAPFL